MKKAVKLFLLTLVVACGVLLGSKTVVADDKPLIVGTNAEYPPFEYIENNEVSGFDADLIKLVAERARFTYKWDNREFKGLIPALQTKTIDIAIAGMSITEERAKNVDFSIPYLASPAAILTNTINPIKSIDPKDLEGKTYGAELGTTKEAVAKKIKDSKVVSYDSNTAALMALIAGKVDAIVMDDSVAKEYYANNKTTTIYVGALQGEDKAIAVTKGNKELLDKINVALKSLLDDGTVQKLRDKYGI
ncbi:MAG: basic amino acid ABC transporter substrate-binding protein [Fusobacteriaceae bacterium]|jgi:polar amino acid transport system substrate-binding protein|nr:basic amino acid ABC transporter substrate-binding protein [Fusobacteriaceae bacterium]